MLSSNKQWKDAITFTKTFGFSHWWTSAYSLVYMSNFVLSATFCWLLTDVLPNLLVSLYHWLNHRWMAWVHDKEKWHPWSYSSEKSKGILRSGGIWQNGSGAHSSYFNSIYYLFIFFHFTYVTLINEAKIGDLYSNTSVPPSVSWCGKSMSSDSSSCWFWLLRSALGALDPRFSCSL